MICNSIYKYNYEFHYNIEVEMILKNLIYNYIQKIDLKFYSKKYLFEMK